MAKKLLFADIETHNAGKQYGMPAREFFRLGQFAWGDGEIQVTSDYDYFVEQVRAADWVVFHNGISFDLPVLFGTESTEPLEMALDGKVICTYVLATLLNPVPYSYTNKSGHTFYDAAKPERAKKWYALENQCFQYGIPGKFGDLTDLAKQHNPPKTLRRDLDYALIPLDDPDFLEYARQDIEALRGLYYRLIQEIKDQDYNREYIWREMVKWSINAQITKNGVLVDIPEAQDRVEHLKQERDLIMEMLVRDFDFPTTGKQPWKSDAGKEAIISALKTHGVHTTDPGWDRTAGGAPSFGGEVLQKITKGTGAEELGRALATLMGQRSLAQLALESVYEDGLAHPSILCIQRSGRTSVTEPGLTVWTAKCGICGEGVCDHPESGTVEKRYFIPEPGNKMVSLDFSSADARAMAALSGDAAYAIQFEVNEDGTAKYDSHNLVGEAAFGKEKYWAGVPAGVKKPPLRNPSKVISHSTNYNVGAKKLAAGMNEACVDAGLDMEFEVWEAKNMLDNFNKQYPLLKRFKDKAVAEGESLGYVENPWGRRMRVDEGRSFTQSPALQGQSVTAERIYDGLIKIARDKIECIRWVKFPVHDEVVLSIPEVDLDWGIPYFQQSMSGVFDPFETSGGNPKWTVSQPIEFLMSAGEPANDWHSAGH